MKQTRLTRMICILLVLIMVLGMVPVSAADSGTSATTFSPDAPCTRGQIVTFLQRALDK